MKLLTKWRTVTAIALAIAGLSAVALAEDWPLVRGDVFGTGVARSAVSDAPDLLWKYSADKDAGFDSTAVIGDGVIYLGDNAGTFHAVRLSDGTNVWKKKFIDGGFGAGASLEKDRVYVGDMNGAIYCLAAQNGDELWSDKLEAEIYAAPGINGADVLFTNESGTLTCRNKQDGEERWQFHIDAPLRCTPTISKGRAAVAGCDSLLHVIDVSDGKEIATVPIDAPTGSTPAMRDQRVYFGTEGGTFYAIDIPTTGDKKPVVVWTYHDNKRNQPIRAAAAVNEKIVVYGSQGKALYGLNPTTGEEVWKLPTKSRIESSPVIAGDRVVAATAAGKIYILDAATGEVKWEYDAGGSFIASPAIVDGKIILGNTDGTLYCFGTKQTNANELTTKGTKSTKKE